MYFYVHTYSSVLCSMNFKVKFSPQNAFCPLFSENWTEPKMQSWRWKSASPGIGTTCLPISCWPSSTPNPSIWKIGCTTSCYEFTRAVPNTCRTMPTGFGLNVSTLTTLWTVLEKQDNDVHNLNGPFWVSAHDLRMSRISKWSVTGIGIIAN